MNPVAWLYGIGISVTLTAALVWALKALHRATEGGGASRERAARIQALLDERDRLLLNLQELDFDHAMRKVSAEDREPLRAELRTELGRTLSALEALGVEPDADASSEAEDDA